MWDLEFFTESSTIKNCRSFVSLFFWEILNFYKFVLRLLVLLSILATFCVDESMFLVPKEQQWSQFYQYFWLEHWLHSENLLNFLDIVRLDLKNIGMSESLLRESSQIGRVYWKLCSTQYNPIERFPRWSSSSRAPIRQKFRRVYSQKFVCQTRPNSKSSHNWKSPSYHRRQLFLNNPRITTVSISNNRLNAIVRNFNGPTPRMSVVNLLGNECVDFAFVFRFADNQTNINNLRPCYDYFDLLWRF